MGDSSGLRFGPFQLLSAQGPLLRDGQPIHLQPKTLRLLWTLARQPDVVVTKALLFDAVWPQRVVTETALSFQIQVLRTALDDDPRAPRYIATVHRVGFRFVARVDTDAAPPSMPPSSAILVGRAAEAARLHEAWSLAHNGQRQLVFVTGEAGIGKTALIEHCAAELRASTPTPLIASGRCIESVGGGEAYLPLLEALDQLCRLDNGARAVELLTQQAPAWLAQMTTLRESERSELQARIADATPLRRQRELVDALERLSLEQPLVLILEDLHWSDPPTVELLQLLSRRQNPARLLLLCSYRPVDAIVARHPVNEIKRTLVGEARAIELALAHLQDRDAAEYLARRFPDRPDLRDQFMALYRRTEGLPLFMVQLSEAAGLQPAGDDRGFASELVPNGLLEMIRMQAARLPQDEQDVLEAASVEGIEFTTACVAAMLGLSESAAEMLCNRLARHGAFIEDRGLAIWPDGTAGGRYGFRHGLYQTALYRQLSSGRRASLHLAVATRSEAGHAERSREIAGELARHYEAAQLPRQAARFHQLAGENALLRCAPQPAADALRRAIDLLAVTDDDDSRARQLLQLHLQLGAALIASRGYTAPAVLQAFAAADELARRLGDETRRASALWGLFLYRAIGADFDTAQVIGRQLLDLATGHPQDNLLNLQARLAMGAVLLFRGELDAAREQLEPGLDYCELPIQAFAQMLHAQDLRVDCVATAAWLYWLLDMPLRARQLAAQARSLADEHFSASSLSLALYRQGVLDWLAGDRSAQARAEELLRHAREYGLPHWEAAAVILHGASLQPGDLDSLAIEHMRQALAQRRAMGVGLGATLDLLLLASALMRADRRDDAQAALSEAAALTEQTAERLWTPALQAVATTAQTAPAV